MKEYDFYYSEKQERMINNDRTQKFHCFFKSNIYTEMIEHGKPLTSKWDDVVFLGTGTEKDCIYKNI